MARTESHKEALRISANRFYATGQHIDPEIARLRKVWNSMKRRCSNPSDHAYASYGGRGITVCERWNIFENFLEDMQSSYTAGLTLERIDNNIGYSPDNCRWATYKEQATNRRNTLMISYDNKSMTLSDWARHLNVPKSRLSMRYYKYKWPIERVLS